MKGALMKKNRATEADVEQREESASPESSQGDCEARPMQIGPELRARLVDYFQGQGYEVTEGAELPGKSGSTHTFDMLARMDDGLNSYIVAVCITVAVDDGTAMEAIYHFANKAYDCGIIERVLIATPELSGRARQLARKQRMKVIDGDLLDGLLKSKTASPPQPGEPVKFQTKEQLARSLADRGYTVELDARVKGKSGVEHTFDALARSDNGRFGRTLGIDFLTGEQDVSLEEVSIFDTKAYDAGSDGKIIVVSPGISREARQFAEHQRIRVLELDGEPASEPTAGDVPDEQEEQRAKSGKPPSRLLRQAPQPEALELIPEVMARRYNAIPVKVSGKTLEVAMADPSDVFALEAFAAQTRMRIKAVPAGANEVRDAIDFNYKAYSEIEQQIRRVEVPDGTTDEKLAVSAVGDTPLVTALNLIIEEGIKARASDIHIEPQEDRVRVRYRIDGTLQDLMGLPLTAHRALISRIKILAGLNIADHFRPQDGQFSSRAKGRDIDVRVATAPTVHGERATLRLLDKTMATLGLAQLGLLPESLAQFEDMLKVPFGMILVSGPTGAGKTTTLYAAINSLDTVGRNVITLEDPAEYRFRDINQIQVNPQAGITFAAGLRSILRLDPDVVLVGEIRDAETANIATQAALTGHLMLSTVHANDVAGVLSRLLDLKVEPFLIASAVIGTVAQRMVRRICPDCSRLIEAPAVEQKAYEREMGEKQSKFLYGTGCKSCSFTGYLGRLGIFEILAMNDEIGMMITNHASSRAIRSRALEDGMVSMMKDGMRKVQEGITTPSEVVRNAYATA